MDRRVKRSVTRSLTVGSFAGASDEQLNAETAQTMFLSMDQVDRTAVERWRLVYCCVNEPVLEAVVENVVQSNLIDGPPIG